MKDIYNLLIELSLQQCTKNDYIDKSKVKAHNKAIQKLKQLQDEIGEIAHEEKLCALLMHKDERVQINAAAFCLQMNVLVDQALSTLKWRIMLNLRS